MKNTSKAFIIITIIIKVIINNSKLLVLKDNEM